MISVKAFQPDHKNIFEEIILLISHYFKIPEQKLLSQRRFREQVEARYLCMYFQRKYIKLHDRKTLKQIGEPYNKDHATVLHGCRTVENLASSDKIFKNNFDFLNEVFQKKYSN